jgi:hypothetical protein
MWYAPCMRTLLAVFISVAALGCGAAQPLPTFGAALKKTGEAFHKLDAAHTAICHDPISETVEWCVEAADHLSDAAELYNEVQALYEAVNAAALAAQENSK